MPGKTSSRNMTTRLRKRHGKRRRGESKRHFRSEEAERSYTEYHENQIAENAWENFLEEYDNEITEAAREAAEGGIQTALQIGRGRAELYRVSRKSDSRKCLGKLPRGI